MKYVARVEYNGAAFCGWQRLSHAIAVQNMIEAALSKVANHPLNVVCAGRTDSGVHALAQIIHFETEIQRSDKAWLLGSNGLLSDDVVIHWVRPIADDFHARFSATARRYRYVILNRRARSALLKKRVTWVYHPLDHQLMNQSAQVLVGEQDFSSFRSSGCQASHANRNIHSIHVSREGDYVYVDIEANAFLYHMVRNIVGSLIQIGQGKKPVTWIEALLPLKDRKQAGPTAKAAGLYFVEAIYPQRFKLDEEISPPHYCF